jgi:hypothetical protein
MSTCQNPEKCGRPITGHPKAGWIKARVAGQGGADRWFCGLQCLVRGLAEHVPGGRPDVAVCPLCINRHDRDHRCGVCNTQPHIARPAPRPVHLYDQARQGIALLQQDTTRKETA